MERIIYVTKKGLQKLNHNIKQGHKPRLIAYHALTIIECITSEGEHCNIAFFHNDRADSNMGINQKMLYRVAKLFDKKKIDYFICCHPECTGMSQHCFLGKSASGRIKINGDTSISTDTAYCHKVIISTE